MKEDKCEDKSFIAGVSILFRKGLVWVRGFIPIKQKPHLLNSIENQDQLIK